MRKCESLALQSQSIRINERRKNIEKLSDESEFIYFSHIRDIIGEKKSENQLGSVSKFELVFGSFFLFVQSILIWFEIAD